MEFWPWFWRGVEAALNSPANEPFGLWPWPASLTDPWDNIPSAIDPDPDNIQRGL